METKFRPVPLSIIDFLGVLVPGFVWFILIVASFQVATAQSAVVTPLTAWSETKEVLEKSGAWLGPLALIFLAVVTGYGVKARALRIASVAGMFALRLHRTHRRHKLRDLTFPYDALLSQSQAYKAVKSFVEKITTCNALPGHHPFSGAKRLLRLKAPALWEECEHREAEVRLVGTLCSATVFSAILACVELTRELIRHAVHPHAITWLIASLVLLAALADAFSHLRIREVEYVYLNTIVAFNGDARGIFARGGGVREETADA